MKKTILAIILFVVFQNVKSQSFIPEIKNNTEFHYVCKLHGQTRTLTLTAKPENEGLTFKLETRGVKSSIVMLSEAVKNGNALSFNQGEYEPVLNLKPNETFFMISRSAYQELVLSDKFIYNNTVYDLIKNNNNQNVIIDGKSVEALHVKAQIDETEMWIVKNPQFPLLCKVLKNPLGIDFTMVKIIDK